MKAITRKKLNLNSLFRVGIMVHSVDEKIANLKQYFHISEENIEIFTAKSYECDANSLPNEIWNYEEPAPCQMKVGLVQLPNLELELMESLDGKGPYADWLRRHGEGVQHFNIDVDDPAGFEQIMAEDGIKRCITNKLIDTSWNYFDTVGLFGFIMETGRLIETQKGDQTIDNL